MRHAPTLLCATLCLLLACEGDPQTFPVYVGSTDAGGGPGYGSPGLHTDIGSGGGTPTPDAGPPDAVAPDVAATPDTGAPDAGAQDTGGCTAGTPCNDGDLCTVDDQCQADGSCAGSPISCDDGSPCTTDACADGACTHTVQPGFCRIAGTCWTEGQPAPDDPCKRCLPNESQELWSATLGKACDDGDPCTDGDLCGPAGCAGTTTNCDDGEPCTSDGCGPSGCTHSPLLGPCALDDGNPCTTGVCDKGACVATAVAGACELQDDNPCTIGACQDGACVATPLTGPCVLDDGNPCTAGACQAGACIASPVTGPCDDGQPCTIGDACDNGVCKPGPLKDKDVDGYADKACGGPDCNDGDKAVHPGAAELCGNAKDDDCDGLTDGEDVVACPANAVCDYHTDCYPERLCGWWPTDGLNHCSDPCGGPGQCPAGHICAHVPGSANVGYCRPSSTPEQGGLDASCQDGPECQSEICADYQCATTCSGDAHCTPPAHVCHPAGDIVLGFQGVCSSTTIFPSLKADGQDCFGNSANCQSGHCDLLSLNGKCAPICVKDEECLQAQQCNVVLHSAKPIQATVPYDPQFQAKTYDAVMGCYNRGASGGAGSGTQCTANAQCRSGKCINIKPPPNTLMWCTNFCATDADCPPTMQCKLDALALNNAFLTDQGTQLPGGYTLVRICKFK